MPGTPVYQPLLHEDAPAAKALIRTVWASEFGPDTHPLVRAYMDDPAVLADVSPLHYAAPRGVFYLATQDGAVVGTGGIDPVSPVVCELRRMFVASHCRRMGIARELVTRLLAFAATAGYRSVRLSSHKSLTAAHRLYDSMGFREAEPWEHEVAAHVVFLDRPL